MNIVQERYRETIGYEYVLMRQLDRIAEARTRINEFQMRYEYEANLAVYRAALTTLFVMLPPRARERLDNPQKLRELNELDEWLAKAVEALDKLGLLIRKKVERMGGEYVPILNTQ